MTQDSRMTRITRRSKFDNLPDFLSVQEVARYTGVSTRQVYKLVAEKVLPCRYFGARILIEKRELADVLYPSTPTSQPEEVHCESHV